MSEHPGERLPGSPECWCLQCMFKRLDAKITPERVTGLHDARGKVLNPTDEAWLKHRHEREPSRD